ncbi:MAG: AAA family ATPase [Bacteroidales bacterium]|nr:AAA family ATPase [Bacteroidales bacterium]
MIIKQISEKLKSEFGFQPTESQQVIIEELAKFSYHDNKKKALIIKGYAGTGKTTLLGAYVRLLDRIGYKTVLLAPTGRAAKVVSTYSKKNAFTIHKKIYRQKSSKDGLGSFSLDQNLHTRTIFIVDEASMITNESSGSYFGSGKLLDDLIKYVYNDKGCKLIVVGDTAQLPPIGIALSPALSTFDYELNQVEVNEYFLTEVVRQQSESTILNIATGLRQLIDNQDVSFPILGRTNTPDFKCITGEYLVEDINSCYEKYGTEDTVIVCRSNKRANKYNQGIRNAILFREEEITTSDLLMVVKNNYFWLNDNEKLGFIANGDIIQLKKIYRYYDMYGYRFADCRILLIDYDIEIEARIMLDVLYTETPSLSTEQNKEFYYTVLEDYQHIKAKRQQYEAVRSNEFFNALQVKHAHAITCHKAQGGQWKAVFVDAGYLTKEMVDVEYLRWLYTAITRATEEVYLVNFPNFIFEAE